MAIVITLFTFISFVYEMRMFTQKISPLTIADDTGKLLTAIVFRNLAVFHLNISETKKRPLSFEAIVRSLSDDDLEEIATLLPTEDVDRLRVANIVRPHVEKLANDTSEIDRIKLQMNAAYDAGSLVDPLSDLIELQFAMIRDNNFNVWEKIFKLITNRYHDSITQYQISNDNDIPFHGDVLLLLMYRQLYEETSHQEKYSWLHPMLESLNSITQQLIGAKKLSSAIEYLSFMQEIGELAITKHQKTLFKRSMRSIVNVGTDFVSDREVFDDVCRRIGYLGELLILRGISIAPLMPSSTEDDELSTLNEAFYKMSEAVQSKPDKYPIILRDAIELVCDRILERQEPKKFKDRLLFIIMEYIDLAKAMIKRCDPNAEIILFLVLEYIKKLSKHDLKDYGELNDDLYRWLHRLAVEAIKQNQKLRHYSGHSADSEQDLCGMIIKYMADMPDRQAVASEMREIVIDSISSRKENDPMVFIRRAGKVMQSNFGYMLDWQTGNLYKDDDPRRRRG